ncbi:helix-turn-helix transcriptional regulator [Paenisporosarcina sp. OV554]|uniref:helix-turn-helix transcriptional regulator n=1 Tax=Paenisporosarcina sp. OV554 TaxID=2135694 RepID=UPI000D33CE3B|nr:helix-turn-helix transcriptional regulator [Paenisporosarcina sp. OV554]PUB12219.1 putative transcriptional regulator [Paenisporosarcina sp. OV554]
MYHNLYIARREKREKQKDLADLLGIHKQSYFPKENGKSEFTLTEAKKLAKHYYMTLDELFEND